MTLLFIHSSVDEYFLQDRFTGGKFTFLKKIICWYRIPDLFFLYDFVYGILRPSDPHGFWWEVSF